MANQVVYKDGYKVPVKMWNSNVLIDSGVFDQAGNMAKLPFIFKHVALMPDAHVGKGATVGSVIPTRGAIVPSFAGVDLGCGVIASRLSLKADDLPDSLEAVYNELCGTIPVGQAEHEDGRKSAKTLEDRLLTIDKKHPRIMGKSLGKHSAWGKWRKQLGTLGGGNHFIELCLDENNDVWLMLHSGSRNIGNLIGNYFINLAKEDMRRHFINLPDADLAYLVEGTNHFDDYFEALTWAQDYARLNRAEMMDLALTALSKHLKPFTVTQEAVNCHHNFTSLENHFGENIYVTRKGAIRAREGEFGIIPGSMGTRSYIVRGKGEKESFCSCSHGAGRVMSRGKAKELITLEEHLEATHGVMCRKDSGVLDESPKAYKDIDSVMASQTDLVEIVHSLKQVLCIKG
jgi:tRNA-splicing ligase RtcB